MKYLNIFYLAILIAGVALWKINDSFQNEILSFYGFAENKETEINFNYPVAIGDIYVTPGKSVKKGMPLLNMYRIKAKDYLVDQPYKINELKAKENAWKSEKYGEIELIETRKKTKLTEIDSKIQTLQSEQKFQKNLYQDLQSVSITAPSNKPLEEKIQALHIEKVGIEKIYNQEISNLKKELATGKSPYRVNIDLLQAEQAFEEKLKKVEIPLLAPTDGLIGDIHCKEAEHIPSYKTLISFYEPNPSIVKGFVQEDLIFQVGLQDTFLVKSTKDASLYYYGVVTGLGSRIVEIPDRLRKIPDLKTYGREVLVSIPTNNQFLQKEKVILELKRTNKKLPQKLTANADIKDNFNK